MKKFNQLNGLNVYTHISKGDDDVHQFYECGTSNNSTDWYGIKKIEDNGGVIQKVMPACNQDA